MALSATCAVGIVGLEGVKYAEADKIYQYYRYCENNSEVSCTWEEVKAAKERVDKAWDDFYLELALLPFMKWEIDEVVDAFKLLRRGSRKVVTPPEIYLELNTIGLH